MTEEELRKQVEALLGDSSSSWCSCDEGDMWNQYPEQKRYVTGALMSLITQYCDSAVQQARIDEAKDFEKRLKRAVDAASEAGNPNLRILSKTLQNMGPIVMLNRPDGEYAMCWNDEAQLWSRARYQDLVAEAKRQLSPQDKPKGAKGKR